MLREPIPKYSMPVVVKECKTTRHGEVGEITSACPFCSNKGWELAITAAASEPGRCAKTPSVRSAGGRKCWWLWLVCAAAPTHHSAVSSTACCNNWSVMTQMKESHHINSAREVFFFWSLPSIDELDLTSLCFTADEIIPGLYSLQPETSDLLQSRQIHNQQSK